MKLITLPHAGGLGNFYRPLKALEREALSVINYEYPGHGSRFREELFTDAKSAVKLVYDELFKDDDDEKVILFGHSMGAFLAEELAVELQKNGREDILSGIIVSAALPCSYYKPCGVDLRSHDAVTAYLEKLGGTASVITHNKTFMELYMKVVTSDLGLFDTYDFRLPDKPFSCFLKVLYACDDKYIAPISAMSEWSAFSENYLGAEIYTGGHFYISEHWESVINEVGYVIKMTENCKERAYNER